MSLERFLSIFGSIAFIVVYSVFMYKIRVRRNGKTPDTKRIRKSFNYQTPSPEPIYAPAKKYVNPETNEETVFLVDINNASAETLLSLPGLTEEAVEKAVKIQDEGGFRSVREFISVLAIKPVHAILLYKVTTCTPVKQTKRGPGRLLDV